jgi:hypothetical protein
MHTVNHAQRSAPIEISQLIGMRGNSPYRQNCPAFPQQPNAARQFGR